MYRLIVETEDATITTGASHSRILAFRPLGYRNEEAIVLEHHEGSYTPYVMHYMNLATGDCGNGHYFEKYEDAYKFFLNPINL